MDLKLTNRITNLMHAALTRKLLTRYFMTKGIEESNWDKPLSPQTLSDLPQAVPELHQKVEVIPYVMKLDPLTGLTEVGWNLFVLGSKRMYLGRTKHKSLGELTNLAGPSEADNAIEKASSARRVIQYIVDMLKASEEGRLEFHQPADLPNFMRRPNITAPYASYYEKRKWGR